MSKTDIFGAAPISRAPAIDSSVVRYGSHISATDSNMPELETSQRPYLRRIGRLVANKVGLDRVIWGSDIPYHFEEIELIGLKEGELRSIMGGNMLRLINYPALRVEIGDTQ